MNETPDPQLTPPPPEAWAPARRLAQRVSQPVERFLHVQAASGIVLLVMAVIALVWANSPWAESYEHLWETPFSIGLGSWSMERSLHFCSLRYCRAISPKFFFYLLPWRPSGLPYGGFACLWGCF